MCTTMSALKRRKSTKLTAAFDEKEQNYLEETCQYKSDKIEKKQNLSSAADTNSQIKCLQNTKIVKHFKYACIIPTGIEL